MQLRYSLLTVVAAVRVAHAFPTGSQFDDDPVQRDGGGGIPFDGAPRWSGHTCTVCHVDAPHQIGIRLESDQPDVFDTGWEAGKSYHFRVVLLDEWAGLEFKNNGANCGFVDVMPFAPCNDNGFALEVDDVLGQPTGSYQQVVANACSNSPPADPVVRVMKDGTAVTHEQHQNQSSWDLCWTAPAAGTGPVTAYIAVVDGNGGNGTKDFPNDTVGDDVAAGAVPIPEAGGEKFTQGGGCSATGDASAAVALIIVALLAIGRRAKLALLLALATASGCAHVRPRQREALAKRNMKFAPDPAEDELDLHMQESREGSSGGYGSSGGGCGCN